MTKHRTLITAIIQLILGVIIFFASFTIIRVPFGYYITGTAVFLFIISIIVGFKWWKIGYKRPTLLSVSNTLLIAVAAFLIGGLSFVWNHGLFVNNPPIINNFFAQENPVEPGETTKLRVIYQDDERDPISFEYKAEKGIVPSGRVQNAEVDYMAPEDETGNFSIIVTVLDNVARQSYPSRSTTIIVARRASTIREYNNSGLTDLKSGNYESAIKSFDIAIDLAIIDAPGFADTYLARGLAKAGTRNSEAALTDFTQYIEMRPDNYIGYLLRASIYQQLGEADKASADIWDFYSKTEDTYLRELVYGFESAGYEERLSILNHTIGESPNPFPYVWEKSTFPLPPPQF